MKNIKYSLLLLLLPLLVSCFDDKSSDATKPISDIIIESGIDSVYNIEKNDVLTISPVISQKNTPKELKYTWEIDMKVFSTEAELVFVGNKLGVFSARLIVENEDGKTFFPFTINVNSPYEEGLTVLSKDENGSSMLAFMRTPLNTEEKGVFYEYDCFSKNNEDVLFASNPSDIVQTTGSVVIACQGSETAGDNPTIYFLNDKTFVMENIIESTGEYEGFKPTKLMIPSLSAAGVSYHLLSADGKMYGLPVYDAVLQPSTKLFSTYSQACFVEDNGSTYFDILFWDKEVNAVALMYNGYGPYYYGSKYLLERDDPEFKDFNYFKGVKGLITLTGIRRTSEQVKTSAREMLVIVKGGLTAQKLVISTFPWRSIEGKPGQYSLQDNGGLKSIGSKVPLDENTPCVANRTFQSLLFANGNKVRRWYYTSNVQINKADTFDLGLSDDAVITAIEISEDHLKTYVGFYEPNKEGKNGSVWVIDTDKGTVLERYDNVCYQPVKIIYKKK